ncbi:UNVERIFIED_ORG: hypothetical protein M2438_002529 [Methylobacterium sp. SuP10 SLI 274]|uniref:hypothetical protein n=1 Tax=Methylorubrum extorquens TaxID=408 RepID=UPI00209C9983|nr:hypothetical protein [Methylorubrum extorquens]MDF9863753.1 hypothetical protein [Methylorubrum pseudosasae]MDH6637354.1 hypothetical protein [Methylobacterium sp. SuP10 SLI 274]MDH6666533.1 hypothetical protein [Methylorubrum zatmanii]MCP1558444.1 hypothetical protein [Methylorubrum extorquens]MDF9792068.1 hypothetical protein [Methylorubrum extorquens]
MLAFLTVHSQRGEFFGMTDAMEWKGMRVLSIPAGVFPDRNTEWKATVNQRDGRLFERGLRAATPRAEAPSQRATSKRAGTAL